MLPWRQGSSGCLSFNTSKTNTRSVIHHSQPSMANQTQLPTLAFTTMVTMTFFMHATFSTPLHSYMMRQSQSGCRVSFRVPPRNSSSVGPPTGGQRASTVHCMSPLTAPHSHRTTSLAHPCPQSTRSSSTTPTAAASMWCHKRVASMLFTLHMAVHTTSTIHRSRQA